jgi:hypothetical protein
MSFAREGTCFHEQVGINIGSSHNLFGLFWWLIDPLPVIVGSRSQDVNQMKEEGSIKYCV